MKAFLSYQSDDRKLVSAFQDSLELAGIETFMDTSIRSGTLWDLSLEEALFSASSVVVLWTPRSVKSRWVRLEARHGLSENILRPVMLEPCSPPIEFSDVQAAQLPGPSSWNISNDQYSELVQGLAALARQQRLPPLKQDALVLFRLAQKYENGDGAPQSRNLAIQFFRKADAAGHPGALQKLEALGAT